MASTHERRRLKPLKSTVSPIVEIVPKPISRFKRNLTPETTKDVLRSFSYQEKTIKAIVFELLTERGPWTPNELYAAINKHRQCSRTTIHSVLKELRLLGLATRANGGWVVYNWEEIA